MRRAAGLAALLCALLAAGARPAPAQAPVWGDYIVVLRDGLRATTVAARHSRSLGIRPAFVYTNAFRGYAARVRSDRIEKLRADPRVRSVFPDREVRAHAQTLPRGVDRVNADASSSTGSGVVVAVLDTGADLHHGDLASRIVGTTDCLFGLTAYDLNGHGSNVAGIVAARNDASGVVGVAPGASLWIIKVLGFLGTGSTSSLLCGIDFVVDNAPANGGTIRVANLSLGVHGVADDGDCGNTNGDPLHMSVCAAVAAGVTFVTSAGNDGINLSNTVPATYDEAITVTAFADSDGAPCGDGPPTSDGPDDTFADFSNYATQPADRAHTIGAPGVAIVSDAPLGGLNTYTGTSQAAPHVAGAAALYLSTHPTATPADVLAALLAAAEPADVDFGGECGGDSSHTDPSGKHPEPVLRADSF